MTKEIGRAIRWTAIAVVLFLPLLMNGQDANHGTQSISQTELLPVFAVDMQIDAAMVDGADVPAKSPAYSHSGVNDTLQQAWDALSVAGFNIIRFSVDAGDAQAAARLANLCIWAKTNSIRLIPVLTIAETSRKGKAPGANVAAAFLPAVVSRLRAAGAEQLAAYAQIAYLQIDGGFHSKPQEILSLAQALRDSESKALQGSGTQATPIMVSASFDYELIRQGAIVGLPLDPAAEQKALASLKQFLSPLAAGTIDAINIEWLAGSITSGDTTQFPAVLEDLKASFPGKQLTLTTGFSTAFNTAEQQTQFFTSAVTTLGGIRAADAASPFVGVVFRQAFKGPGADTAAPNGSDPSQWNWKAKAQQLAQMWSQDGQSAELAWWLNKVRDNMGMVDLQPGDSGTITVVPLPAQQAFQQISTVVAQASQNAAAVDSPAAAPAVSGESLVAPAPAPAAAADNSTQANTAGAQATPSPNQAMLYGILQQVTTQLTTTLTTKLTTPKQDTSANNFAATQQYQPPVAVPAPSVAPQPDPDTTAAASQPAPVQATPAVTTTVTQDPTQNTVGQPNSGQPTAATGSTNPASPAGNSPPPTQGADVTRKSVPVHPHWGGRAGRDSDSATGSTSNPSSTTPASATVSTPSSGAPPSQGSTSNPGATTTTTTATPTSTTASNSTPASTGGTTAAPPASQGSVTTEATPPPVRGVVPPGARRSPVALPPGLAPPTSTATPNGITTSVPAQVNVPAMPTGTPGVRPGPASATGTVPANTTAAQNGTSTQPVRPGQPAAGVPVRPVPGTVATPASQPATATSTTQSVASTQPVRPGPPAAGVPVRPGPGAAATPTAQPAVALPARPGPAVANVRLSPTAAVPAASTATPAPNTAAAIPAKPSPAAPTSQGYFDLSVSAPDIRYAPMPAQQGQPTLFVAIVRNNGTVAPPAASLVFSLIVDGRQVAASQPLAVSIAAHGTAQANWTTTLPPGRQMQLVVLVTANGDQNPGNNQATISFAPVTPAPVPQKR